jgi:hypothetical protein
MNNEIFSLHKSTKRALATLVVFAGVTGSIPLEPQQQNMSCPLGQHPQTDYYDFNADGYVDSSRSLCVYDNTGVGGNGIEAPREPNYQGISGSYDKAINKDCAAELAGLTTNELAQLRSVRDIVRNLEAGELAVEAYYNVVSPALEIAMENPHIGNAMTSGVKESFSLVAKGTSFIEESFKKITSLFV